MSTVFDFVQKNVVSYIRTTRNLAGPPEIWQDHQIPRAGGLMVHCLEM